MAIEQPSDAPWRPPYVPDQEVVAERMRMWFDLLDTCEQFLLAGLRYKIGPDGDLDAAYREWREQDDERRSREKYAQYRDQQS